MTLAKKRMRPSRWFRPAIVFCTVAMAAAMAAAPNARADRVSVNPVKGWIPVLKEFQIPYKPPTAGMPPPFQAMDNKLPSIRSDWHKLQPMVTPKLRAYYEDEPLISGWQPWARGKKSGIEVRRATAGAKAHLPVAPYIRSRLPIRWQVEVWPPPGSPHYQLPRRPDLKPAQKEYQKLVREKVTVQDLRMDIYKVTGPFAPESAGNKTQTQAYKELISESGIWSGVRPLSYYQQQEYIFPRRGATFIGELRFKLDLNFEDLERGQATAYATTLEAALRFIVGEHHKIRVISDKLQKIN